jgi:hypothetical protein
MSVVLTVQQATTILETLSLLTTAQHQHSKLIMHDASIELESDSSLLRTVSAWTSAVTSYPRYIAGYQTDSESRILADLPPLMRKVHQAFINHGYNSADVKENKTRLELAQRALEGLNSLQKNKYLTDTNKTDQVEEAKRSVKEIIAIFEPAHFLVQEDPQQRLIAELRLQNAHLTQRVADQQKTIEIYDRTLGELGTKIARLKAFAVEDALSDPPNIDNISMHVIVGRIHVLSGVLAARQT